MKGISRWFLLLIVIFGCKPQESDDNWTMLFNGTDLASWDTYLGPKFDSAITWENIREMPPVGLNNDPDQVFSIVNEDGFNALRISGVTWGGVFTRENFENYHLQLFFKWGVSKSYPRENNKRDSGLLYHGVGKHPEHDLFWLRSQEYQIQEGDVGDYWGVGGAGIDVPAVFTEDSTYQFTPSASLLPFYEGGLHNRRCWKNPDAEKPSGEWNQVDLYCFGDSAVHVLNGKTVMFLTNSRIVEDGKEFPLRRGKIEIQSEGAEVFYRDIRIQPISEIPESVLP